ncbi:hypothetical protein Bca52824_010734 [Brassica carinata]|uniref:DUF223 domain-containing protein n=1 Tax=Brassica carinata TaxID=52824 RepID=A0A8X7WD92_BRACI|nr:hypothetical protein Bca52824_010734 [Brassica carinata]
MFYQWWKVEVKVLRLWTQHFAGQETFEFVVEDKMVHLIDHNIEGSSGDVSTSCSKRKEGDADLNDMNSTSKKLCAKKLIMEKTEED